MNTKVSYIAVGLFVLILGIALVSGILWIGTGGPRQAYDLYLVYMTGSVSGVTRDGAVKYRGVDVGNVSQLGLDPVNPERIRLLLKIEQGTPIKQDTVASLEMQGLTGLAYISLQGGSRNSPPLEKQAGEEYPVIPSKPSRFEELSDTVMNLLGALAETSTRLNNMLNTANQSSVENTLANLHTFSERLAGQSENITSAVQDFRHTMDSARQTTSQLPALVAQLEKTALALEGMANEVSVASRQVGEAGSSFALAGEKIAEAGGTVTEVGDIVADIGVNLNQTISASGKRINAFTRETLPEAGLLINDLRQAAGNMRQLVEQLEANPSMLLYGAPQPQPGPGE